MEDGEIIRQFNNNALEHKTLMDKLDIFGDKLEDLKIQVAKLPEQFFEKADSRYASKTAERLIYALVGIVLSAFVVALWELIIK